MPRIVKYGSRKLSSNVGVARLSSEGVDAVGRQLANIGGDVANLALKMRDKQRREETVNYTTQSSNTLRRSLSDLHNTLKNKYTGTDHAGYQEEFDKEAKTIRDSLLEKAPSEDAKGAYLRQSENIVTTGAIRVGNYVNGQKSNFRKNQEVLDADEEAKHFYNNPNLDEANFQFKKYTQDKIKSAKEGLSYLNGPELLDAIKTRGNKVAVSTIEGMIDVGDIDGAREFLESEGKQAPELYKYLTPAQRIRFSKKIASKEDEMGDMFINTMKDKISLANEGVEVSTNPQEMQMLENKNPDMHRKFVESLGAGVVLRNIKSIPPNQWDEPGKIAEVLSSEIDDPLKNKLSKVRMEKLIVDSQNKIKREVAKNPPKFFVENDMGLNRAEVAALTNPAMGKEYLSKIGTKYKEWGLDLDSPDAKILTPRMVDLYGGEFKRASSSGDFLTANNILDQIKATFPDHYYKALNELDIPPEYSALAAVENPDHRTELLGLLNSGNIKKEYSSVHGDTDLKDFKRTLRESDIFEGLFNKGGGESPINRANTSALVDLISLKYMDAMLKPNSSSSTASDEALKIFESQYNMVEEGNAKFPVPAKFDSNMVRAEIEYLTESENPAELLGANIPEGGSQEGWNEVVKKSGVWRLNNNEDGVELWVRTNAGLQNALDKNGKRITLKFGESGDRFPEARVIADTSKLDKFMSFWGTKESMREATRRVVERSMGEYAAEKVYGKK